MVSYPIDMGESGSATPNHPRVDVFEYIANDVEGPLLHAPEIPLHWISSLLSTPLTYLT